MKKHKVTLKTVSGDYNRNITVALLAESFHVPHKGGSNITKAREKRLLRLAKYCLRSRSGK